MAVLKPRDGQNPKWVRCDLSEIFENESLQKHLDDISGQQEVEFTEDRSAPPAYDFPDIGANRLQPAALRQLCTELSGHMERAVAPVSDFPACMIMERRELVWGRVIEACLHQFYSDGSIRRALAALKKEEEGEGDGKESKQASKSKELSEKLSGNDVLIEVGVRTGMSVVFSLLKQAWAQFAWQKQLEQQLHLSGTALPFPGGQISVPNQVLRSVLDVLKGIPPLSLANTKSLSKLSFSCLEQASEFLDWIVQATSFVDTEGKRLASEIILSLALQHGSLNALLEWLGGVLGCLAGYSEAPGGSSSEGRDPASCPSLSLEFCLEVLEEIRKRTVGTLIESIEHKAFEPQKLTPDGNVSLLEFGLFLCQELSEICRSCTQYFSRGNSDSEDRFLSETCDVYAFGSNSSSQLAMGSTEKLPKATPMSHMANCQVVEAGQYCSFLLFGDGTLKACGKGSYGRLGLGNSDSQSSLRDVSTFPPGAILRRVASSRGSDGHTVAITTQGEVYSWGDGNYGKLGHGDNTTHKVPKLIAAFEGKVIRHVACGNRHSAAVTADGELYTWGEGDYGRLGHGNSSSLKTPTRVDAIGPVRQVACGAAHTLALAMDGLTVYSFGSGDSGKLGHGDTNRQTTPKVVEGLRGMLCQKVCATSQFSLALTAAGKVYSWGNGSGVGKGTTEPRQYTPWLVEALEGEMIIDVATGDGHCLALTQRGEVYAWGTNSMGQCGHGHSNGSITTPAKVQGLDGVQVQQISAGTSHSIVWTAVPIDRRASAMWHWPYCVNVGEKTFKSLLDLLNQYGSLTGDQPPLPFESRETQEQFVFSMLSLVRTHLSLAAPLGPSCVHMACGAQVKPLRSFLFRLIDSQLPPALDQVTSESLEVGSSVLLPPVLDRLDLLLSILPEDPSHLPSLTVGQHRQLDLLLMGFMERGEFAGVLVDEVLLEEEGDPSWVCTPHARKLFTLCDRMVDYLHEATMALLDGDGDPTHAPPPHPDLQPDSALLQSFRSFLLSVYLNVVTFMQSQLEYVDDLSEQLDLPYREKLCVMTHFEPFYNILKHHTTAIFTAIAERAREAEDPVAFLESKRGVIFSFLAHDMPSHVALTVVYLPAFDAAFGLGELLVEVGQAVHQLVALLPPSVVEGFEREELSWEPINMKPEKIEVTKLRTADPQPWRNLIDLERTCCWAAGRCTRFLYTSLAVWREGAVLEYSPGKGKPPLLSSHLLSNGTVGDVEETAEAIRTWVSLCKALPLPLPNPEGEEAPPPDSEKEHWANFIADYNELRKKGDRLSHTHLDLLWEPAEIQPCDPAAPGTSPLLALAVGARGNAQAELMYDAMMELARYRDWNTCSDEDSLPQLRQVSCATLACLLKHTGLFLYASSCSTKPKKPLVDIYRAVFSLRREVFTNRPIPDSEGKLAPADQRVFATTCNGISATLFFLTCVLSPALPEESEPIVPQIATSSSNSTGTSADDVAIRSPGARSWVGTHRLFSHPEVRDDSSPVPPTKELTIYHSASHAPQTFLEGQQGWSLPAVKQALSHLRWQKDRDMHATTSTGSEGCLHQKIAGTVVDLVGQAFLSEKESLSRRSLLSALMTQQTRAELRRNALKRMLQFIAERKKKDLLPSSKLIYLSHCLTHSIHYSEHIEAAPSILQHEIKNLSHSLLEEMVSSIQQLSPEQLTAPSSQMGFHRDLLLALQWTNFSHKPGDLYLLFSGGLYTKMAVLSGVVSSQALDNAPLPSTRLASRLRRACVLVTQLLALRVGMNAEVLKTRPDILATVSDHLYGQLEGYVCTSSDPRLARQWEAHECDVEERETLLGEFLCFLNTLSATHVAIRSVLASDVWFGTLLRIVDINTATGVPKVASLKTRLLALQVLGAIMAELADTGAEAQAKCSKIIEDFLELMYRCMFLAPVSYFQENVQPYHPLEQGKTVELPFTFDPAHQHSCTVTTRGDSPPGALIEGTGGRGYALGHLALSCGKYTWKVSVESDNAAFCVGVAQKPLTNRQLGSSAQFWALESHTGRLYHEGESNELLFSVSEGDSVVVEYDSVAKTLAFGKNNAALSVAYHDVVRPTKDLYPMVIFTRRYNTTKVCFHPISHCSQSPLAHLKRREQLTSGYPLLSPTGMTLAQALVSTLHQLQDREPWSRAITQVLCSKLSEMDALIHRLLDIKTDLEGQGGGADSSHSVITPLSLLISQFTQVVWPCLAVVGGLDSGACLGRECQMEVKGEPQTVTLVSVPDSDQKVEVQNQVTASTASVKKRSASLSELKLLAQRGFHLPLLVGQLSPSVLMNLAHLAGFLEPKHSLSSILQQAHRLTGSHPHSITSCLPYHQLCESLVQMAATKSLHAILFDESIIRLLSYQPPPMEVVIAGDYVDKSELAQSVREVLKCLAARSIKPSPLKPTLKLLELERIHAVLGYESLATVAEYMHLNGQLSAPDAKPTVADTPPPSSPHDSPTPSAVDVRAEGEEERGGEGEARASTPPMVHTLLDMGFSRAQVNVALERCEIPPNTDEQARMNLLVSWIIDHPEAVSEEEARLEQAQQEREVDEGQRRQEEQLQQQEADRDAAASEFLSLFGEIFDPQDTPGGSEEGEEKRETKHAPDLLEGPDIDDEVPDVSLTGLDTSPQSLILSALGLSQKRPTPKRFQFAENDPLGENLCRVTPTGEGENGIAEGSGDGEEDDTNGDIVKLSPTCENMVQQVQKLRSLKEHLSAVGRITSATQTLVARHITMLVIASLSTQSPRSFISSLRTLDLVDVKSLVRLLRLVHAGRIDGTPGKSFALKTPSSLLPIKGLECLSSAVTTVVSESAAAGDQLMQACSRDLLAAAVGGAELLQKSARRGGRRHRERTEREKGEESDVSVLSNPSFSVSRSLVQTMAEATGKVMLTDNSGVLNMTDALSACLFSSKLEPEHRFWALEQLLKMFSSGRKEHAAAARTRPDSLVSPSQLEHLTSHKGQVMACAENRREKKIISIGEDNTLMLWDLEGAVGGQQPEVRALPFPHQPSAEGAPGLLLPALAQSFNFTCVAGAVNDMLCVWRVRDGKTVCENFPELISALQWKPTQRDGEAPLLLVGLVSGELTLVEVLRARVSLTPETQTTKLEHYLKGGVRCLAWSPGGSQFAVASTSGQVQIYSGAGREYSPTAEIKEVQVTSLAWSPDETFLAALETDKTLKLWDLSGEVPSPAHTFDAYSTCYLVWHSATDSSGRMLLASGSQDGAVHLWTVEGRASQSDSEPSTSDQSESSIRVSHVTTLQGHQAPISVLAFSETAVLLASGCQAGSVRIWDLKSLSLLKLATRAVGEVLHLSWTSHGLAVCYRNTGTLCLLPPGPLDYPGERCLHSSLPTLHLHNISEPDKAPCLSALLRNLHYLLQDQYKYEEGEVSSAHQLVHSQYLQLLTALAVGLGLHHVLVAPPHPPHFDPLPPAKEWQWLNNFTMAIKMAEALSKRSALPPDCGFQLPKDVPPLDPVEKYQTTDNSVWLPTMDSQILDWVSQQPEHWWQSSRAGVFSWGKGSWNQLGHSTRERSLPAVVEDWHDVQQIVAGSYCTYAVKFDGTAASIGEGSYGRLGHGGSENESNLRVISSLQGIPVVQLVAGPRVSTSTDEGFALALTDGGDVYSWGKGYKGRLGHSSSENCRSPKLVEALSGKDIKMLACCDYHCAAVTTGGRLYTFGSKENGKLGHGRDTPSGSVGHVTEVTKFLDSDEQTELDDVKIGYVSCGQTLTIAISEDGTRVFGFGKSDHCAFGIRRLTGDHYHPMLLDHLSRFGPFVKSACGYRIVTLINSTGQLYWFGKLSDQGSTVEAELVAFSSEERVVEVATAGHYMLALSEGGEVYSWGKNSGNTCELGYESSSNQNVPKLIENLAGKGIKQISAGIRHAVCSDCSLPVRGVTNLAVPSSIPAEYSALKEVSCRALHARLLLLNHFAKLMISSWRLFSTQGGKMETARFHINPLTDSCTRSLVSPTHIEGMIAGVVSRTMVNKSHGPSITVQRITQDDRASRPVFPQIATQILQKPAKEMRCPSRAWKISLVGEGADDAGGVFDETIAQMCEELEQAVVKLLIPTPNATNKLGFNTDRFVFDPSCTTAKDTKHFKFLGILFGVAMRTKKPLDLHLAQAMWKLLAGMSLTQEDLEEVDLMFMQTLYGIRDIHKSGIKEEDFSEMIPIESFEAQSMNGKFVPVVPGGSNIKLTFHNRKDYVEKALQFRLHELDQQVAAVREGMASIVPVPLLSLCTAKRLETAVCGSEEVDILMLKKVVRYRDGISENDQLVQWLWQTLESFTNEEKILFLRFVSGRSRLPTRVSEIPQRFQVMKWGQSTDGLPTSQTCFFQIRLPTYSSPEVMAERLRYAIRNCRSIDMDNYMLRRNNSGEPYYDSDDDDYD